MKNAMILVGLWVGIILAAYAFVYLDGGGPTAAQLALLERLAERTYSDPGGLYTLETPPGWRVTEIEDGVYLVDPLEKIEAWVLTLGDVPASEAIAIACGLANPCPGPSFAASEELPAPSFAYSRLRVTYAMDEEDLLLYGVGFETPSGTYVLLVRGDAEACEQRAAELTALEESFVVLGADVPRVPPAGEEPVESTLEGEALSETASEPVVQDAEDEVTDAPSETGEAASDSEPSSDPMDQPES